MSKESSILYSSELYIGVFASSIAFAVTGSLTWPTAIGMIIGFPLLAGLMIATDRYVDYGIKLRPSKTVKAKSKPRTKVSTKKRR